MSFRRKNREFSDFSIVKLFCSVFIKILTFGLQNIERTTKE